MMNPFEIKENITRLLHKILERSVQIKHDPNASVLEIDLQMDDLRDLYRQYESLRSIYSSQPGHQAVAPPAPEEPADTEAEPAEVQLPEPEVSSEVVPPPANVPQQESGEPLAMEREPRAQEQPASQQQEPVQQPEPQDAEPQEEAPAPPQAPKAAEPPAETPQAPVESPGEAGAAPQPQEPAEQQQPEAPETPLAPPEEPVARPAGPRAIIDLFSEPAEKSIGDHFKKEDDSLHQRISQNKGDASIGTRMQQSPVADMRSAIGVNDKFLFINELFHGNIQSYNEAIARLNGFENVQPAFEYLNELARTFSWDEKRSAETIEKLANIVQRRYMKA